MNLHWPQITWCVLAFFQLSVAAVEHGKVPTTPCNFFTSFVSLMLAVWLLWCGGFFA